MPRIYDVNIALQKKVFCLRGAWVGAGQLGAADVVCVKGRVQACLCKSPPRSSFHVLCMLACWNIGTHKEKCCDYFIPPNVCSVMLLTSDWSRNMLQSTNKCKTFHLCFLIFHAFSKMTLLFMYFILNLPYSTVFLLTPENWAALNPWAVNRSAWPPECQLLSAIVISSFSLLSSATEGGT